MNEKKGVFERWLDWIYDEREQNFFFLCEKHLFQLKRPQDGYSETQMAKVMTCDFPKCKGDSSWEYFPNLFPKYKNYEHRQTYPSVHNKQLEKDLEMVGKSKRGSKCKSKKK